MAVYFIAEEGTERVKIGYSESPWSRLKTLQAKHPRQLILMRVTPGIYIHEEAAHRAFKHLRLPGDGEWFTYSDEMWDYGQAIDLGRRRHKYRARKQWPGFEPDRATA